MQNSDYQRLEKMGNTEVGWQESEHNSAVSSQVPQHRTTPMKDTCTFNCVPRRERKEDRLRGHGFYKIFKIKFVPWGVDRSIQNK